MPVIVPPVPGLPVPPVPLPAATPEPVPPLLAIGKLPGICPSLPGVGLPGACPLPPFEAGFVVEEAPPKLAPDEPVYPGTSSASSLPESEALQASASSTSQGLANARRRKPETLREAVVAA
jgi:hypothetical protein